MSRKAAVVLGSLLALAFAFAISIRLAIPRMAARDYATTRLWELRDGAYYPGGAEIETAVDSSGVVLVHYGGTIGTRYNPVTVSQYAIRLSGNLEDPTVRDAFLAQVEWLRRNAVVDPVRGVVWEYDFNFPVGGQRAPWISAMAQGQAISALTRAYRATGDSSYLRLSASALKVFELDERDGGVRKVVRPGISIYREYPNYEHVVLDGWIAALTGIQEYYLVTKDPEAEKILEEGVRSLRVLLPHFYGSFGIYQTSGGSLSNPVYFELSFNWLRYLAAYHPELRQTLEAWEGFIGSSDFWDKYLRVYYNAASWRLDRIRHELSGSSEHIL